MRVVQTMNAGPVSKCAELPFPRNEGVRRWWPDVVPLHAVEPGFAGSKSLSLTIDAFVAGSN